MVCLVESRVQANLRAARIRRGWTREVLAYHSGVSWSAIAQIEAGRRKDVRLGSLVALASALDVTVDYLIGTAATISPRLFEHHVLTYGSDDEFMSGAVPFLAQGIERSECLLAVLTTARSSLLRSALDARHRHIEFADWADWYRSPPEALRRYDAFVTEKFDAGASWVRVVAEAAWGGRPDAEIAEWTRYESLVNLAFASSPITIMCTYDERSFAPESMADAGRTHPTVASGGDAAPALSATYRAPADFLFLTHDAL